MIVVLTLTWNGLDKLRRLKDGLYRNLEKTGQNYIWYIRSNGCSDGTCEEIATWPNVKVLSVNHNRDNFAQGMNSLAWMAYGFDVKHPNTELQEDDEPITLRHRPRLQEDDVFLLLNNDVEFGDDDSLSKMLNLMTPKVGVVGARLLYPGTNKLAHAGVIFSPMYNYNPYHYCYQEQNKPSAEVNRYFQAVTAAVCMIRVGDFIKVKGFDELFNWAFDDIDLNLRIGQTGKKIAYCGQTKIFHVESASLKKNPINKLWMAHNVNLFKSKWSGKYTIDHDLYLKNPRYNEIV